MDCVMIDILNSPRDGARFPITNLTEIDLAQANHLRSGTTYEHFIGGIELVTRDWLFKYRVTQVFSDCKKRMARDAFQQRRSGRRDDLASSDDENVFSRALSHIALRVEHDRLLKTKPDRFRLGQDAIDIIPRDLGFGHHNIGMMAREGRDVCPYSLVESVLTEIVFPFPHCDGQAGLSRIHVQGPRARSHIDQRADVTFSESIGFHGIGDSLCNAFSREWQCTKTKHLG